MHILVTVIVIAIIALILFLIVDRMSLPGDIGWLVKILIGLCAIVAILERSGLLGSLM